MWQLAFILAAALLRCAAAATGGKWDLLLPNVGISAMHMQLLYNNRVIMFDRTDFGKSNLSLPNNKCRVDKRDKVITTDCTAHSIEYDVKTNNIRPLMVLTDVWCSSGAVMSNGELVQTGGYNNGDHAVRTFKPCDSSVSCDWEETKAGLTQRRWYATNHILPDGRQIIIGGRRQFNYEFYPKTGSTTSYSLPFLVQTNDPKIENNLYPFVFLNTDGNLFIFANNRSILFDYQKNEVVRTYPEIPGGDPRSYPSTGSAVLLPLKNIQKDDFEAQVLVCGGAPKGSYNKASNGKFVQALDSCGRIKINEAKPQWVMEKMPMARIMGDMLLLPNAKVLIINGGSAGTAGWELGRDPVFSPVLYNPDNQLGSRFEVQNPSKIPRMYHSAAILLNDGRVLVGGSNPHTYYNFTGVLFPTELSLESFSPSYLDPSLAYLRPTIISSFNQIKIGYGEHLPIRFSVPGKTNMNLVRVTMVAPSFTTHSFAMNQRLLVLKIEDVKIVGRSKYQVRVVIPGSVNLAPSGYYMIFVVHQDIPSEGIWIKIQ